MADSVSAYRTESDQEEILSFLRLKSDNMREISASVGRRYSERAAIFDMEEDELSFYFQALQRANQELARMALKSGDNKPVEKAVADLQLLHDLQLKLARIQDADEVLIRIAQTLKANFEKKQGVIYTVDSVSRKLAGRCWASNKKAPQPFSVDLDAEGRPVQDLALPLDDLLITKLVKTRNSRFLRTTEESHKTNLLQYCAPYLIVPLVMGGNLAGEIILLDETKDSPSSPLSDMTVKIYGYLASITVSALASIQLSEKEQDISESLSRALQKNALIMSHLKQAVQRFEYLFEYSNDAIILHNMDGKIIRINQRSVEFLGYTPEEFEGLSVLQLLPASEPDVAADALKALWRNERGGRLELKLQHKDGRLFDSDMSSRIVDLSSGLVQSILRDISLRKQGERDLAAEKERLAVTLRSIGEGVITTNKAGAVVMINKIAEELTGFTEDESIHKPLDDVFHIVHAKTRARYDGLVKQVLESGESVNIANHIILLSRNGVERSISASCAPIRDRQGLLIGVVLVFRDVTEKLKMEKEVLKAQKLESIGVFAGGIAHDFNNILSAIIGNVSLAKMIIKSGGSATDRLEDAEKASYRARDLTGQLLSFSRGGAPVKKTASIVEIIKDSASFVLSGSNVRCEFSIPEDLWPVEADVGQISQVISNMVINAQQAMPGGGVIYVGAENIHDVKELSIPAASKDYVRIAIEDHGVGIPEENLHKIFDPYFTTKSKGNGLGLATSYSIIANHGGYITVESEPNERTVFQIYLPASSEQFTMEKPRESNQHIGKGKILIMDDEESVRTTLGMMLEYVGYEVGYAKDGSEAVDLYRQSMDSGRAFNAVLMDLTVPGGMGGEEAMKRLRELDPQVNAIISSGYFHEPIIVDYRKYGFRAAITKPFRMEELNKILPKVLAGITV
jgi:PAS domain S-box-containing protein